MDNRNFNTAKSYTVSGKTLAAIHYHLQAWISTQDNDEDQLLSSLRESAIQITDSLQAELHGGRLGNERG